MKARRQGRKRRRDQEDGDNSDEDFIDQSSKSPGWIDPLDSDASTVFRYSLPSAISSETRTSPNHFHSWMWHDVADSCVSRGAPFQSNKQRTTSTDNLSSLDHRNQWISITCACTTVETIGTSDQPSLPVDKTLPFGHSGRAKEIRQFSTSQEESQA